MSLEADFSVHFSSTKTISCSSNNNDYESSLKLAKEQIEHNRHSGMVVRVQQQWIQWYLNFLFVRQDALKLKSLLPQPYRCL